jgi:hypothetical protein
VVVQWSVISIRRNVLVPISIPGTIGEIANLQLRWRETGGQDKTGSTIKALTAVVAHKGIEEDKELFQFSMSLKLNGAASFASVDAARLLDRENQEDQEIEFLYRHIGNYAYGHGIAVDWEELDGEPPSQVMTAVIPSFYQERLETSIAGLSIKMDELAKLERIAARAPLEDLVTKYEQWIGQQESSLAVLTGDQLAIGKRLIGKNQHISQRMRKGLEILFENSDQRIFQAFQLANKAMYLQQQRGLIPERKFVDKKGAPIQYPPIAEPDPAEYGTWRPFQIGFLLMAIAGIVDPSSEDRDEVDLIFFPTGGGKPKPILVQLHFKSSIDDYVTMRTMASMCLCVTHFGC